MPARSVIMTIAARSGTYRPLPGAAAAVGEVGQLFYGREIKIEVNYREEYLSAAIGAVRAVHPYEEPVINVVPLANAAYGGTV